MSEYYPTFVAVGGVNAAKAERRMEEGLRCRVCGEIHESYECPVESFTHVYGRRVR